MLYLIGGPPRMGKSSMAQLALKEHGLPYVSTDGLTVMLKPIGQPSFYDEQKSELFFPYLELFISRILKSSPNYLIEGDAFSPAHIKKLQKTHDLKCIFLIMSATTTDNIINNQAYDTWASEVTKEHLEELVVRIGQASAKIQEACTTEDLPCFDLANDYYSQFNNAYSTLMDG